MRLLRRGELPAPQPLLRWSISHGQIRPQASVAFPACRQDSIWCFGITSRLHFWALGSLLLGKRSWRILAYHINGFLHNAKVRVDENPSSAKIVLMPCHSEVGLIQVCCCLVGYSTKDKSRITDPLVILLWSRLFPSCPPAPWPSRPHPRRGHHGACPRGTSTVPCCRPISTGSP